MNCNQANNTDESTTEADDAIADALPPKQELALQALLSSSTRKEAALAAGISETTLWRYMQDEAFSRRLREARRDALNHTGFRLLKASSDAASVLRDLMMNEHVPASARISASRTIIDYSVRVAELEDLKSRIDQLEAHIKTKQEEDALDAALREAGN